MKLIYEGKFISENQLPVRQHPAGAVRFREAEDMKELARNANALSLACGAVTAVFCVLRGASVYGDMLSFLQRGLIPFFLGLVVSMLLIVPHEFLHALCFRGEVRLFTNLSKMMLFVCGTEDMSRRRFVFMSLLPNVLFGFVPFVLYMIFPSAAFLAGLAFSGVSSGAGDYLNVFYCLTQVPRGALVYGSGLHSYWYIPEK